MSKKVLFVATVVKAHIMVFHLTYLKMFKEMGYEVHVAAKNDYENPLDCVIPYCDKYFDIPFERSPLKAKNIKAYKELKRIVTEEKYDIIHCHTPVGGVVARLAARKARKNGTKVIYTAHGFHFYKGAPLKNWLLYYPAEKFCSRFTDKLITINHEDYALAQKKFKANEVCYVPGVGIDLSRFQNVQVDRNAKRREIGVSEDCFLLLSVGELNKNKNHQVVVRALAQLDDCNIHYAIAGIGDQHEHLFELAKELGVSHHVHLLGYRSDVAQLYRAADVYVLPSVREGLNVSVIEAMASGLPVVCSCIRGNTDLIDEDGGALFESHSVAECGEAIKKVMATNTNIMGKYNQEKVKNYSVKNVLSIMKNIYKG